MRGIASLLDRLPVVALFLFVASLPAGDGFAIDPSTMKIRLRVLEGREEIPAAGAGVNPLINLDSRLSDLRPRLQSLHFRAFELLSESDTVMKLNEIYTFPLAGGHEIQIKPMDRKRRKVCFWLRWEHDGVEMLDTKLHFSPREGFVTGTTVRDDMAKIIALDVIP